MIRRCIKVVNRVLFVMLFFLVLPLNSSCNISNENFKIDALDLLFKSRNLELIRQVPLRFDTYHVQGLDITGQFYFVTSVDTEQERAWLFKIDRKSAGLISKRELTDGVLIHPGGLQYDGHYLWIPNAEYKRQSRTIVYGLDPDTLEILTSFSVDDHIGAVASDGKGILYGVNWDALHFYTWNFDGHQLYKVKSPTSMAYQDMKYFDGKLLCSGHKDEICALDIIDSEKWTLIKRIHLPKDKWKSSLTREGMTFDGNLYFLPDDGPNSCILTFALR